MNEQCAAGMRANLSVPSAGSPAAMCSREWWKRVDSNDCVEEWIEARCDHDEGQFSRMLGKEQMEECVVCELNQLRRYSFYAPIGTG